MSETPQYGAERLLALLGIDARPDVRAIDHPALAWRRSGLLKVTGRADRPGLVCPAALTTAADSALAALRALADDPDMLPTNGALLLGERARLMGLRRQGRVSANGSCRLIDTRDGRITLNLARDDDWDLVPILLQVDAVDGWAGIEAAATMLATGALIERGIELGLPIARDGEASIPDSPFRITDSIAVRKTGSRPLVLDFAPLWAGPLAASLLRMCGADVIKVESARRLDGARFGHAGFYDLLNAGKSSVTVDFDDADQRRRLAALVDRADIVIEGSRPRALKGLGVDRDAVTARGGIWVSITAHEDPDRVGFGDDAAVAAGIATAMAQGWGEAMFAGDAIADPLTGIHAALAAWALWRSGRGGLVRLSLAGTTAFAMQSVADAAEMRGRQKLAAGDEAPLYPLRMAGGPARPAGADNALLAL